MATFPTLEEIKVLRDKVDQILYLETVGEINFPLVEGSDLDTSLPLEWFNEEMSSPNPYKRIFSVWDSGLPSMVGKSLYQRCNELVRSYL